MVEDLAGLPDVGSGGSGAGLNQRVEELLAAFERLSAAPDALERLSAEGGIGRTAALSELLDSLDRRLGEIADVTELGFFAQVGPGTVIGDNKTFWEPVQ